MSAIGIGIICFLALFVLISYVVKKRVTTLSDFWIVGRKGKWYFYAATLAAGYVSMWTFMAGVGTSWKWGPTPTILFYTSSLTFGWITVTMLMGLRIRKLGCMTITEYYRQRFAGDRDNKLVPGIGFALAGTTFFYLLIQIQGSAIVLTTVFGIDIRLSIALMIVILMITLGMSGMWSVVVTDMFTNIIFITVAISIIPVTVRSLGGLDVAINAVNKAQIWSATGNSGLDMGYFVGYALAWLAIIGGAPHLVNLTLILEERKSVFKGTMVAFIMVVTLSVGLFISGAMLNAAIPPGTDIALDSITPRAAMSVWPIWLGILIVGGAMAAAYTTAMSQIMTTSMGVVDIFRFLKKNPPDDKTCIRYTRIVALILLLIVGIIASSDIWILAIASSLAGIISSLGIFPTMLMSLYWKGVTKKAATIMLWLSVPIGLFLIITNTTMGWFAPFPTIYSYPIGFGGLFILSKLTQLNEEEKLAAIRVKDIAFIPEKISWMKVDKVILAGALVIAVGMWFAITKVTGIF